MSLEVICLVLFVGYLGAGVLRELFGVFLRFCFPGRYCCSCEELEESLCDLRSDVDEVAIDLKNLRSHLGAAASVEPPTSVPEDDSNDDDWGDED